jgi:hypothetical protein
MFSLAFLKPMYKVLSAESCSGGDTTMTAAANENSHQKKKPINQSIPHQKTACLPSASLLHLVVNKEVEQQFSGRAITL